MLKQLTIQQFVIIDKLTLHFEKGLSVVTGETGAGKSILMDALGLILGDAPDPESVRYGSAAATVEALFIPPKDHGVWKFLQDNNIPVDNEIAVKRVVGAAGGDDAIVNGTATDFQFLQKLGMQLAEIHGQFANQSILDPARQLSFLDAFGNYRDLLAGTRKAWEQLKEYERLLDEERKFMAQTADERITLTKTVAEMKKLKIKHGEYAELDEKQKELTKIKNVGEMLQAVQAQLVAGSGAERSLIQANRLLEKTKHFDPEALGTLEKYLSECLQRARDSASELINLMPDYEIDTSALIAVEERLDKFRKLAAQYETPPEQIMELFERLAARLLRIQNAAKVIAELEDKMMDARREYNQNAQALSKARKAAAQRLSTAITAEFPPLRLMQAEFKVEIEDLPNNLWGPLGINAAVFTARTNKGMPFSTIAKTASGGELARMILALKVILQKLQMTPTLIFDEIDTGVGGATAAAVGQRLALLAQQSTQVMVITHSPQVASRGKLHMVVSKAEVGGVTLTQVTKLDPETRVDEIARMIAGAKITKAARMAAMALLEEASEPLELTYDPPPGYEQPVNVPEGPPVLPPGTPPPEPVAMEPIAPPSNAPKPAEETPAAAAPTTTPVETPAPEVAAAAVTPEQPAQAAVQ
ncbi:MAG: DNA repair protein RecN [Proteobacteria bacterium]|nr:DNA repair protein RecN [Pseudomonadota bacterium]